MIFQNIINADEDEVRNAKLEAIIDAIKQSDAIDNEFLGNAFEKHIKKVQE